MRKIANGGKYSAGTWGVNPRERRADGVLTRRQIKAVVEGYFALYDNSISEPEFSERLGAVLGQADLAALREVLNG